MAGQRQARPVPLELQPGLYSNETDRGAKGRWVDGDNVRWMEGVPEKMGGYELADLFDTAGANTLYSGKARSTWEWSSLDGETWLAFGTACKLYLVNRDVLYDITPMRRQATLVNALTTNGSFDPSSDPDFASCVLWLQCNGTNLSTSFLDSSSYARVITAGGASVVSTIDPKYGTGAGLFPGAAADFLSTPIVPILSLHNTPFTIQFWVRPSAAQLASASPTYLIGMRDNTNSSGLTINLVGTTGTFNAQMFGGGSSCTVVGAMVADTWYHVAYVYTGTEFKLYFNGVGGAPAAIVGPFSPFLTAQLRIGADVFAGITPTLNGQMDEVQIFRLAKYTANFTPPAPPFLGSLEVPVVDVGHGAQDGDHIRISGASNVGGIDINGEHDIVRVIDLDNYIISIDTRPLSSAAGGGSFTIQYDISCGLESDTVLFGYGTGDYGEETYGTPRSSSTFVGRATTWSLDNWGEDLLASPKGGTLYEWKRITGPDSRATAVVGAPANIERMLVGPDDRHVIALGTNLVSTGQQDRMFARWCKGDDYTDWLATDTNDAGSKRLDSGSRLITAVKTRNGILNYTNKAIYFTSLVGGTDVYQMAPAGYVEEIISPESAVDVDGTVYWMSRNNFYVWDGANHVLDCDISTKVFGTTASPGINQSMASKVHVRTCREFSEIIWSYPSSNATENDSQAIYNYKDKCWTYSSVPREAGLDESETYAKRPYALYNGRIWIHESGVDGDDGEGFVIPLHSFLRSYEGEVEEGGPEVRCSKLIPDFDELNGPMDVSVTGRERPQSAQKTRGPFEIDGTTEFVCPDIRVRQIAILVDSNDLGVFWRMGTWRAYIVPVTRQS